MSDATTGGSEEPPPPVSSRTVAPDGSKVIGPTDSSAENSVFKQQLAQTYLIIDHISMNQNKRLPGCCSDLPPGATRPSTFIEDIYTIHYPPAGSQQDKSAQAKILVCALDELNRAAAPANGMTIAFTIMIAGEDGAKGMVVRSFNEIARAFGRLNKPPPSGEASSRLSLAQDAFPTLVRAAGRFRAFNFWMTVALIFWVLFTCWLSWNVASGNTLLGQVTNLVSERNAIGKQIASSGADATSGGASEPVRTPTTPPPGSAITVDAQWPGPHCAQPVGVITFMVNAKQAQPIDTLTGLPLCQRKEEVATQLASARENLHGWLHDWRWVQPNPMAYPPGREPSAAADENDAQWAAALMNVLAGAVLPIFYGVLGAGAAVMRNISARIRDSVLAPRDMMLGWIQLVLGAVIGVSIGLFLTPAGDGGQSAPGLLGSVHLTASALCFVAGFGVEQVFLALEALMKRVFNTIDLTHQTPSPAR
jgi:hypothetical protein